MVLVAILVATALILVNAFYVAAEFAAVSVRQSRLRQLADDGNAFARWLLPRLATQAALDRYIATNHPILYRKQQQGNSVRIVMLYCSLAWTISFTVSVVPLPGPALSAQTYFARTRGLRPPYRCRCR